MKYVRDPQSIFAVKENAPIYIIIESFGLEEMLKAI